MSELWLTGALAGVTWLCSLGLTRHLLNPASAFHFLDHPNARSLHCTPVPRTGGLAILASALSGALLASWRWPADATWWLIGGGVLGLAAAGLADDRQGLARRYRLLTQLGAALALILAGLGQQSLEFWPGMPWPGAGAASLMVVLFGIVWMTNLYNFMDGMDGLAGSMAIIGFLALGWLGHQAEEPFFAVVCLIIAAAAAGFLAFNAPPARIFMGDVGSSTLGFAAAALMLLGSQRGLFPLWVALLIFSPFIIDASLTLTARIVRREPFWEAHRSHHYQRLVRLGWSHARTLGHAVLLMGACALTAIAARHLDSADQRLILSAWLVIYALLTFKIRQLERRACAT